MAELTLPAMNFTALGQLPAVYQKAQADELRKQTLANLGQGGQADATALLKSGDMSLAQLGIGLQNRQADDAWRREESARSQKNADRSYGLQVGAAARANEGPEEKAGQRAKAASSYGIQPGTPEFKSYVLTGALPEANSTVTNQTSQRAEAAKSIGLTPDHPAYQSYILTGKMPREDAQPLTATDKKAILEADEGVMTAKTAIDALQKATDLSSKAFAGPMASKRGYAASFLGESSDIGKGGIATAELDNVVTSNALTQLKAIFGGAPTEGERKILLDIQGSVNQPHEVRKKIYERASEMAKNRLKFNEQRAAEMRGGQFYKPQGSMTRAPVAQPQGAITQQQYEALPSGSPFTAPDGSQRIKP